MTAAEVIEALGEPSSGHPDPCINCTFRYLAPVGSLTVPNEGYVGLEIHFRDGELPDWRTLTGTPSFNGDFKMPAVLRWELWIFGILLLLGSLGRLIIKLVPVAIAESESALDAFASREIPTRQLPTEFRFVTHETTLAEVIDKVGPYSRLVKIPVNPESGLGYAFAATRTGMPVIITFEYDLPYHAAVVIMPEYPFEQQNRIRAVFYRPVQPDLAEATES